MLPSSVSTWPGCVNPKENKVIHMHVHKDKGISEILLIKLVKTRGTLRGFVCSYDNNDAGNGVGYAKWGQNLF
jgi:hypothetical protein